MNLEYFFSIHRTSSQFLLKEEERYRAKSLENFFCHTVNIYEKYPFCHREGTAEKGHFCSFAEEDIGWDLQDPISCTSAVVDCVIT